jgi:hypothetical protein
METKGRQHVYKEKTMKKADCRITAPQSDQMVNHEAGLLGVSRTRTWHGQ